MRTWKRADKTLKYKVGDIVSFHFPKGTPIKTGRIVQRDRSTIPYLVEVITGKDKSGNEICEDYWIFEGEIINRGNN